MSYPTADTTVGCSSTHTPADAAFLGAILQSIDRALVPVAHRYGHDLAEDVHVALLRRLDTGRAFVMRESWCDDGVLQHRAIDAWMRPAAWGEAGRALRRRGEADVDAVLGGICGGAPGPSPAHADEHRSSESRQVLVAVRRATRSAALRPATRDLALRVLDARLHGATYAQAADDLGLRTNTAIQYVRRLLQGVPPATARRVADAIRGARSASHQAPPRPAEALHRTHH